MVECLRQKEGSRVVLTTVSVTAPKTVSQHELPIAWREGIRAPKQFVRVMAVLGVAPPTSERPVHFFSGKAASGSSRRPLPAIQFCKRRVMGTKVVTERVPVYLHSWGVPSNSREFTAIHGNSRQFTAIHGNSRQSPSVPSSGAGISTGSPPK